MRPGDLGPEPLLPPEEQGMDVLLGGAQALGHSLFCSVTRTRCVQGDGWGPDVLGWVGGSWASFLLLLKVRSGQRCPPH